MNLCEKTLSELIHLFREGTVTSREITESFIAQIEAKEPDVNAFVNTTFDLARQMADSADSRKEIDPKETLYIEDIAKNLSIGKERGTITAWLINDEEWGKKESNKEYIDYKIENLTLFLKEIRLLKNQ